MSKEKTWPDADRRIHPRVPAALAAQIVTYARCDEPIVVRPRNISCSGVLCHVHQYIPPFERLHLSLIVPLVIKGRVHNEVIQIDGVTVRVDPDQEDSDVLDYHVAIFFEDVTEADRKVIARYVDQQDQTA